MVLELPADIGDLLFAKRQKLAEATKDDVEKLLIIIQVDDDLSGRLIDSEVRTIREQPSRAAQSKKLVAVVATADRPTHLRFIYALYGVNPDALDIVQANLRVTVRELFYETLMTIGPDVKGNLLLRRELSAIKILAKSELNIFLFGRPGIGKSALVNSLLGERVAPETNDFYSPEEGPTSACYKKTIKSINVSVWDSPSFLDADTNPLVKPDLILFCVDLTDRLRPRDVDMIKSISGAYKTREVWKNCLVVMTKANMLRSPDSTTSDTALLAELTPKRAAELKDLIQKKGGLSHAEADAITCVPAGTERDDVLAGGKEWLPEFWASALEVAKGSSAGILLHCNEDRLKQTQVHEGRESEKKMASNGSTRSQKTPNTINLCRQQSKRVVKKVVESSNRSWSFKEEDLGKLSRIVDTVGKNAALGIKVGRQLPGQPWAVGVCAIVGALLGVASVALQ